MLNRDSQEDMPKGANRRGFIRGSSLILASALPKTQKPLEARVALFGCDRRGTQLAAHTVESGAKLVALADFQRHRIQQSVRGLRSRAGDRIDGSEVVIGLPVGSKRFAPSCLQPLWAAKPDFVLFSGDLSASLPGVLECLNRGIGCYLDDIASLGLRDLFSIQAAAESGCSFWAAGSGTSYLPRFQSALAELQAQESKATRSSLGDVQRLEMTLRVPANPGSRSEVAAGNGWDRTQFVRSHAAGLVLAANLFGTEPIQCKCPVFVEYGEQSLESRLEFVFGTTAQQGKSTLSGGESKCRSEPILSIAYHVSESTKVISAKAGVEFTKAHCDLQSGKIRGRGQTLVGCESLKIPRVSHFAALDRALEFGLALPRSAEYGAATTFQAAVSARNLLYSLTRNSSSDRSLHLSPDLMS